MSIRDNFQAIQQQLPADRPVKVVVVTKYATNAQMIEAYEAGARDFGENKIQDTERKFAELPPEIVQGVRWHFLGHLQRNKIKKTLQTRFNLIHSVDSLALAQKVSEINCPQQIRQNVLLQVNLTREPQKTGFWEDPLLQDFGQVVQLHGISVMGLMTIGPHTDNPADSTMIFCHLRDLRDRLVETYGHPLPELSMGMSKDFKHAIECGATIIRIGNRLFGS